MDTRDLVDFIVINNGAQKKEVIFTTSKERPNLGYEHTNGREIKGKSYIAKEVVDLTYVRCLKVT